MNQEDSEHNEVDGMKKGPGCNLYHKKVSIAVVFLLKIYSMSVVGCAVCRSNYFKNFTGYDSCLPCSS